MPWPEIILAALLLITLGLFIKSRLRQDVVAWLALMVAALAGLVAPSDVWAGLSNPAVVSVAAVLVLSAALTSAGVVDWAVRPLERVAARPLLLLAGLLGAVSVLSAFINNVGALALLMPVALRLAKVAKKPASMYLMPLAFASLLGGMTTLIGTPPNLIVSGFRQKIGEGGGPAFSMFDFALVGVPVAVAGVVFLIVAGRKLVPERSSRVSSDELANIAPYLTEAHVPEKSPAVDVPVGEVTPEDVQVLSVVRGKRRFASPSGYLPIRAGDVLVLMGAGEVIERFVKGKGLDVAGVQAKRQKEQAAKEAAEAASKNAAKGAADPGKSEGSEPSPDDGGPATVEPASSVSEAEATSDQPINPAESSDVAIAEAVVKGSSWIVGRSAASLRLRDRFGVNLLGLAREGSRQEPRLASTRFRAGDVILLQGHREDLPARIADLGCLALAERPLALGESAKRWRAVAIFAAAIALVAVGLVPAPVAFVSAAVGLILTRVIGARQAYDAIDWPVLSLLAAMIPLGLAIESTGLASRIASVALWASSFSPAWVMVAVVLIATMFLSDLVNNAAAAVMMCPIALGIGKGLGVSADPFLMAVAIGASCAFLTPIGHQSNLLVMGPGGYRFGDYWRAGLVLEAIIAVIAVPLIVLVWPMT